LGGICLPDLAPSQEASWSTYIEPADNELLVIVVEVYNDDRPDVDLGSAWSPLLHIYSSPSNAVHGMSLEVDDI